MSFTEIDPKGNRGQATERRSIGCSRAFCYMMDVLDGTARRKRASMNESSLVDGEWVNEWICLGRPILSGFHYELSAESIN